MKLSLFTAAILFPILILTYQVTYQQKHAYLQKLLEVQRKMYSHIQQLRSTVDSTVQQVDTLKSHPDLQKTVLQSGIKVERDQLQSTFKQTIIPLKDNYWSCKNLSYSQKDLIAKKIKDLKDKTDSITRKINGQNDCTRNVELKSHVRFLKLHIQSLQNQLSNTCEPMRKDDHPVNNLKDTDKNWIYGDKINPQQYDDKMKQLEKKNNLVPCPKDKPFLINNQCAACSKPQQLYSLSQEKCIENCPQGKVFLKFNHECIDPTQKQLVSPNLNNLDKQKYPFVWGPITEQQYNDRIKQLKDNKIPIQQCPADKPFPGLNGQKCVQCSNGQVFNVGTKNCQSCQNGQKYIEKTHQCKTVYKKPNYDKGKNWIALNGDKQPLDNKLKDLQNQNHPVQQCPADKPFPSKDLTSCVSCDKYYDLIKGECDSCQKYFQVKQGKNECTYVSKTCETDHYWNGQNCTKCLKPGFYDNNQRKCQCPVDNKYDAEVGKCFPSADNLKNGNPTKAINYVGTPPAPSKFLSNCPEDKPFFQQSTNQCIQCPMPHKYYSYDNKRCQQCDKNLEFNIQSKQCSKPIDIFNSNIGPHSDNYCCGQPHKDDTKNSCPSNQPFFDGYHCISCQKPQYFDFKQNKCKRCPDNEAFSSVKKQCVNAAWVNPKIASNIPTDKKNYKGTIPEVKPDIQGQQISKCPAQRPFSNGQECISCDLPRYYNFDSHQCQLCKQDFSFSTDKRQCIRNTVVGGDFFNSNMVNAQNFIGKVPQYKKQYPQCSSGQRYFNGKKCQRCQLPQYWDFDKIQCRDCNKNMYFNKYARKCLYEDGAQLFKTNIDANKTIYYNGKFDDVKNELNNSNKQACPKDKPFFDKSTNQCISCWGDNYIFNYLKNHCMKCQRDTHFNEQYHICFQNGVQPTIQRMVMNSVSWI